MKLLTSLAEAKPFYENPEAQLLKDEEGVLYLRLSSLQAKPPLSYGHSWFGRVGATTPLDELVERVRERKGFDKDSSEEDVLNALGLVANPDEVKLSDCHVNTKQYGYGWLDTDNYEVGRGGPVTSYHFLVVGDTFAVDVSDDDYDEEDEEEKEELTREGALRLLDRREKELLSELKELRDVRKRATEVAKNFCKQ